MPVPVDRPWRVLVIGDSVAASLAGEGPTEHFGVAGVGEIEVLNAGSPACPVILDGSWWFPDGSTIADNPVCDAPERYDDEVAAFAPDVVLAVFGWPGVGGGQRFDDGAVAVPCEPRFDDAWEAGYRALIERLEPVTTIVVATVAPLSMDSRRAETRCLNRIVHRLPAEVLDLATWLCPESDCSWHGELRTDGVHFADEPALRREAMHGILGELVATLAGGPVAGADGG